MAAPIAHLVVRVSGQIAELQKDMKGASAAVERFGKDFEGIATRASIVGNVIGNVASRVPGALIGMGRAFLDLTSKLTDLSDQSGISVRQLQRLSFAGDTVGVSIDEITRAVGQLQNRLGGGDKGAVAAVAALGLNLAELSEKDPAEQFELLASAIAKIEDPSKRAHLAMELFGRGGIALMPLLRKDVKGLGDNLERLGLVMSDDVVKGGDDVGDTFTLLSRLGNQLVVQALDPILKAYRQINDPSELQRWQKFKDAMNFSREIQYAQEFAGWLDALRGKIGDMPTVKAPPKVGGLGAPGQFTPTSNLDDILRISGEMSEASTKAAAAHKDAAEAGNQHAEAIKRLREELSGAGAVQAMNDMVQALSKLLPVQNLTRDAQDHVNRVLTAGLDVYRAQGREVPPHLRKILLASMDMVNAIPVVNGLSNEFERLGQVIAVTASEAGRMVPVVDGVTAEFGRLGTVVPIAGQAGEFAGATFGEEFNTALGNALQRVPDIMVNAFLNDDLSGGLQHAAALVGGELGAALGAAIGGPAGAAIGRALGENLLPLVDKLFDRNKGRDVVVDFAAESGGFDALHEKLATLNTDTEQIGEKLWIALTQGVGRNNPTQAQAAIDAVTAAFDKQAKAAAESGKAAVDASAAQVVASTRVQDEIRAMDAELSALMKSVENEAFEVEMGNIEKEARARISIVEKEKTAAQLAIIQTGEAGADVIRALDTELARLDGTEVTFKVKWDVPPLPGVSVPGVPGGVGGGVGAGSNQPIQLVVDGDVLAETFVNTLKRNGVR